MTNTEYWRATLARITGGLGAREADDLVLYRVDTAETAYETLRRGCRAAGYEPQVARAGTTTRFAPGCPAILIEPAGWCALCSVTADGRIATVDDVAVWEAAR